MKNIIVRLTSYSGRYNERNAHGKLRALSSRYIPYTRTKDDKIKRRVFVRVAVLYVYEHTYTLTHVRS